MLSFVGVSAATIPDIIAFHYVLHGVPAHEDRVNNGATVGAIQYPSPNLSDGWRRTSLSANISIDVARN